jgi:peptidoglycan hydrolase-like protein with peptidoglycan-binding domain
LSSAEAAPAALSATPLGLGDVGPAVSDLQTRLDRLLSATTWVPVTGRYDTRTADAVAYVQRLLHVTGDPAGVYGPQTRAALTALT